MNKKPKVVDKMIDIMLRTIPLQPLPLTLMEQKAKPSSKEYQRFNNMAKRKAGKIALPSLEEMDELDRLKSEYDTLYHTTSEPDDYCDRAQLLLDEIEGREPLFKKNLQLIADAVSSSYLLAAKRTMCKESHDVARMRAWNEISPSL